MNSRPRSRTFTTPDPTKRRSLPAEYDGYVSKESANGGTTEPAAAYISTRLSPPDSPLPDHQYDAYKEQRLYNFVMSTSSSLSPASARPANHSRGNSVSSGDGNFFTSLFTTTSPSAPASPQAGHSPPHSRNGSLSLPQGPTSAGRKFSHFFGLGANDTASNSGLAFSSAPSSHRSVSNSTTLSNLVLPERTGVNDTQGFNGNPMIRDEFAGMDFAELLNSGVPKSPLNCTPQGFHALHGQSMELIERLYAGYMERTRALADALAEIEALRDDLEQKEQKVEGLKFSCEQLANVQEALSKASEEAEKTATKANAEVKKLRAENERLEWEVKSIREIEMDDASSISSSAPRYGLGLRPKDVPQGLRSRTKSSNSDSGFESESDSGSVFSNDGKMAGSAISSPGPTFTAEDEMETSTTNTATGPLAQLRNVLRRTTTMVDNSSSSGKCDCNGTIGRLKSENNHLTVRVKELEGCLDSCLDLVGGI
ncbi:hypothetical protein TWF481_009751 [Arthrobotrys musiformis]|uniref:GDP/GTP exchange factor Sec2 N-terminal domain-containing protein n=1 Tax=Arthrobotrys musiformis TaxID=47236 RepID=A0AAV9W6P9_9PEZI